MSKIYHLEAMNEQELLDLYIETKEFIKANTTLEKTLKEKLTDIISERPQNVPLISTTGETLVLTELKILDINKFVEDLIENKLIDNSEEFQTLLMSYKRLGKTKTKYSMSPEGVLVKGKTNLIDDLENLKTISNTILWEETKEQAQSIMKSFKIKK